MAKLVAFDSKEFRRSDKTGNLKFYTPLGCGLTVSKKEEFVSRYVSKLIEVSGDFDSGPCGAISSTECMQKIGPAKAYKMLDDFLKTVQDLIDSSYFSYVILPAKKFPEVEVGGYRCPKEQINTFDFLRSLSAYFSYITAWNYLGIETRKSEKILIDDLRFSQEEGAFDRT